MPTHARRVPRPDGTIALEPFDANTPEGAELLRAGGEDVQVLDQAGRDFIAREQDIARQRSQIEDSSGLERAASTVQAGIVGVADELSLGALSRLAPEARQRQLEAGRQADPGANVAGRVLGAVVPALMTGGESLLARGSAASVLGRLAPSGAIAGLGNAAERWAARTMVNRGLGPGLSTAIGTATGATIDGAVGGLAAAVTNSNIAGVPLEGEQALADIGIGAGIGFGLGSLLGGIRGGFATVRGPRATADMQTLRGVGAATDVPESATLGVARDAPAFWEEVMRRAGELPPEDHRTWVRVLGSSLPSEESRSAFRRVVQAGPRAFDDIGFAHRVRETSATLGHLADTLDDATLPLQRGTVRQSMLRTAGRQTDPAVVAGVQTGPISSAAATIQEAIDGGGLTNAAGHANAVRRRLETLGGIEDSGDLVAAIDDLLEHQSFADLRGANADGRVLGDLVRGQLLAAGDRLTPQFSALRNARDALEAARSDAGSFFRQRATGEFSADPRVINDNVSHSVYQQRGANLPRLIDFLVANDAALEVLETAGVREATVAREAVREAGRELPELIQWGQTIGDRRFLQATESQGAGLQAAIGRGAIMGVSGMLLGGARGAAVGTGLGVGTAVLGHPVGFAQAMAGLETTLGRSQTRLAQGTQQLRRSFLSPRLASRAVVGGRAVPRVVQALRSPETREREFNAMVEQVRDLAGNPDALQERVNVLGETFSQVSPEIGNAAAMSMVMSVHHLAQHLPPAAVPTPFGHPERRPSHGEMIDFIRRVEALEDPYGLLSLAAEGRLTEAHVEAVSDAFPRVYAQIQSEVTGLIQDLEDPRAVPYALRTRVGMLLGVEADESTAPALIFSLQQSYSQTAAQRQVQGPMEGSFTVSAEVADNTMSRAASLTHGL